MLLDCHTHVLPAIDDGAPELATSLALLDRLAQVGVTEVVTTPHWCSPRFQVDPAAIARAWQALSAARPAESRPRLHLGAEHHLSGLQPADAFLATLRPLGDTRVVLIELPDDHLPSGTWQTLFAIARAGYRPMLAHPERCKGLSAADPQLRAYTESGGLLQLTLGHLLGAHGLIMRWRARRLVRRFPQACVLASDSHDLGPRRPRWQELPERWRHLCVPTLAALERWPHAPAASVTESAAGRAG